MADWSIEAASDALILSREGVRISFRLFSGTADLIHRMLREDALAPSKIASPGFLTQAQVDEAVKAWRLRHPEAEQIDIEDLL